MAEVPRLNSVISALEQGKPALTTFASPDIGMAQTVAGAPYDAVVFDLEHNPCDVRMLRDCMQYMLDRRRIALAGSLAASAAPMVRIPANGGEMNQFLAKQVLDVGAYGVIWPHVGTEDEARNAVSACRYPRPPSAPYFEPQGSRGDGPKYAPAYWGVGVQDYYARADVWPLNPQGEILVGIMCEEVRAIRNLPQILERVPGIGLVLVGEGDLSQDLGFPRQYDHPAVASAVGDILAICKAHGVVCGHPHVEAGNAERVLAQGFGWLMAAPVYSFAALELSRRLSGRD